MKNTEAKIEVFNLTKRTFHSFDNFIMSTDNVALALVAAAVSGFTICGTLVVDVVKSPVVLIHNRTKNVKKNEDKKIICGNIDLEK